VPTSTHNCLEARTTVAVAFEGAWECLGLLLRNHAQDSPSPVFAYFLSHMVNKQ